MSPEKHEWLLDGFSLVFILIGFLFVIVKIAGVHAHPIDFWLFCGLMIGFPVVGSMIIYLVPVRCDNAGCGERMKPGWARDKGQKQIQWRLFYKCKTCENAYYYGFTFGLGDNEPWT